MVLRFVIISKKDQQSVSCFNAEFFFFNNNFQNFCSCFLRRFVLQQTDSLNFEPQFSKMHKCKSLKSFLTVAATCFIFVIECVDISHFITEPLLPAIYCRGGRGGRITTARDNGAIPSHQEKLLLVCCIKELPRHFSFCIAFQGLVVGGI